MSQSGQEENYIPEKEGTQSYRVKKSKVDSNNTKSLTWGDFPLIRFSGLNKGIDFIVPPSFTQLKLLYKLLACLQSCPF